MKKLTEKEIATIKDTADSHFGGDLNLASAAHVHGVNTVKRVGSQIAVWFDRDAIEAVASQLNKPAKKAKK